MEISGPTFLNTLVLLGALQGFIVCILLFLSRKNRQANSLLGALLLLISLASLNIYLLETRFFLSSKAWRVIGTAVPFIVTMPIGPLLYFYIRSSLNHNFKLTRKDYLHFTPALLDIIPNVVAVMYAIVTGADMTNTNSFWKVFTDEYNIYIDIPRWISVSAYLILSIRFLRISNNLVEIHQYGWLKQLTHIFLGFQIIWFAHLIPYIMPMYRHALLEQVGWYPVYIPLTALVYWLGIKGYFSSQTAYSVKKVSTSSLSPEIISAVVVALQNAMGSSRLYLSPSLNLSSVASHLSVPPKTISAVLNQHMKKSFNEFVNHYRIEEFKKKAGSLEYEHLTITGLAFECGFNSQATFQRTFKQSTGMSPSEFLLQKGSLKTYA